MRKSPIRPETKKKVTVEKKSALAAKINRLTAIFARTVAISRMGTKKLILRWIVVCYSPRSGAVLAVLQKICGNRKIKTAAIKAETPV